MKIGQLIPGAHQRVDIVYCDGTFHGGLHCGNAFDVLIRGDWLPTRIEYCHETESWYLAGIEYNGDIFGLTVRI